MAAIGFSGFDWDDGNLGKCQKHGLTLEEIEHVLAHNATVMIPLDAYEEPRLSLSDAPRKAASLSSFSRRARKTGNAFSARSVRGTSPRRK